MNCRETLKRYMNTLDLNNNGTGYRGIINYRNLVARIATLVDIRPKVEWLTVKYLPYISQLDENCQVGEWPTTNWGSSR